MMKIQNAYRSSYIFKIWWPGIYVFLYLHIAYIYFFQALKKHFHFFFIIHALRFDKGRTSVLHMGKFRMMFLKWMQLYFTCFPFSFWETYVPFLTF